MKTMKRSAHATWSGSLMAGEGRLSTQSKTLEDARFSFPIRFGDEKGTNPEELIAAAHAGCFSMGLTFLLGNAGMPPQRIETEAELSVEVSAAGPRITGIRLSVKAQVPGCTEDDFQRVAMQAKETCLVSKLVQAAVPIALEAELVP